MKSTVIKHFNWFMNKAKADSLDSYSAQVSFFTIISFIPFMMFLFSLLEAVNINGMSLLHSILDILPSAIRDFLLELFTQGEGKITILSISALTCLWASSRAMLALIKGLNSVFDVSESRNYFWLRATSIVYTVILAIMLAFTALILVFGNTIYRSVSDFIGNPYLDSFFDSLKYLMVFILLTVFFTFSFKVIPRKSKVPIRYCIIGAALSALSWVVYSYLFSIFVENFGNYASLYGSLAALVIFMLWLYFCMYFLFIGGATSVWLNRGEIQTDLKRILNIKKTRS